LANTIDVDLNVTVPDVSIVPVKRRSADAMGTSTARAAPRRINFPNCINAPGIHYNFATCIRRNEVGRGSPLFIGL
jgi:hypothetical protein